MTQEKLDNQRDVVKNERRWSVDNQPYGTWDEKMQALVFPDGHPYHHPTIGSMEDLTAASLDDVREFFATYYAPNNAVLTIAGDFEPEAALEMVEKHFGPIPANPAIPAAPSMHVDPIIGAEVREELPDRVPLPRIYAAYRMPAFGSEGFDALEVAIDLLGSGRASRLYRALVREQQVAQDATAFAFPVDRRRGDLHHLGHGPTRGRPRGAGGGASGPRSTGCAQTARPTTSSSGSATCTRAGVEVGPRAHQRTGGPALDVRLPLRRAGAHQHRGQPLRGASTPAACARRWTPSLRADNRVVLTYVPAESPEACGMTTTVNPKRPAAGVPRPYHFPPFMRRQLANGLNVWTVPIPGSTLVNVHLLVDAGAAAEDEQHGGIAALTAQLLVTGTRAPRRLRVRRGDGAAGDRGQQRVELGQRPRRIPVAAAQHLDEGLGLLAEMIREPRFDAGEFERLKAERLADILQSRSDPGRLADETFLMHVYADDTPYRRALGRQPRDGREALPRGRGRLPRDALPARPGASHHRRLVRRRRRARRPSSATWRAGKGPARATAPSFRSAAGGRRIVIVDRPESVQSELRVGHIGIDRYDPRYFPAIVMSTLWAARSGRASTGGFGRSWDIPTAPAAGSMCGGRPASSPRQRRYRPT